MFSGPRPDCQILLHDRVFIVIQQNMEKKTPNRKQLGFFWRFLITHLVFELFQINQGCDPQHSSCFVSSGISRARTVSFSNHPALSRTTTCPQPTPKRKPDANRSASAIWTNFKCGHCESLHSDNGRRWKRSRKPETFVHVR